MGTPKGTKGTAKQPKQRLAGLYRAADDDPLTSLPAIGKKGQQGLRSTFERLVEELRPGLREQQSERFDALVEEQFRQYMSQLAKKPRKSDTEPISALAWRPPMVICLWCWQGKLPKRYVERTCYAHAYEVMVSGGGDPEQLRREMFSTAHEQRVEALVTIDKLEHENRLLKQMALAS